MTCSTRLRVDVGRRRASGGETRIVFEKLLQYYRFCRVGVAAPWLFIPMIAPGSRKPTGTWLGHYAIYS